MGLKAWAAKLASHRRAMGLASLLVAFTGVSMILNPTHAAELSWIGAGLLTVGACLFALWVLPRPAPVEPDESRSLGARLINWLTWRGRLLPYFPVIGAAIAVADIAYNILLSATPTLQTEDIMAQLSAVILLLYGLVPTRFSRERDFVLLFLFVLDLLLVVPLLIARLATQSVDTSVDVYSWTALAPELGAVLSFVGVANSVHAVAGSTAPGLTFTPVQMYEPVTLVITTACSGIYSFGIFASAYIAFIVTEYSTPSRKLWALLGLGFCASYVANLFRMVVIVLVGYYVDTAQSDLQSLLLAHSYAGWVIFLGWLALFWGLLFRILPINETGSTQSRPDGVEPKRRGAVCPICRGPLSPALPAERCTCGTVYHVGCIRVARECPACHFVADSQSTA